MNRKQRPAGFTILEIVIIVVVVSILATLAIVSYIRVVSKGENTEALTNLGAIRRAEHAQITSGGTFVNATDTGDVNNKLSTADVQEKTFKYKVVNATQENFTAIAERVKPDTSQDKPIVIAMYSNGDTSYTYPSGSVSSGGSSGTGDTGSSSGGGSSGGSGSAGGSGGGSGGSGGGSGGGSSGGGITITGGGSVGGSSGGSTGAIGEANSGLGFDGTQLSSDAFLQGALGLLQGTANGNYFYNLIQANQVNVSYAPLGSNELGLFIPSYWLDFYPSDKVITHTIYINSSLENDPAWTEDAVADIIVHESMHADYDINTAVHVTETTQRLGVSSSQLNWLSDPVTDKTVLADSVDQEYKAFTQQVLFWKETKGVQTNSELDYILSEYESDQQLGTDLLYQDVASRYSGYAPYDISGGGKNVF